MTTYIIHITFVFLLVLQGHAHVMRNERQIATISRGEFVAEMSFLTGEAASADVLC